MSIIEDQFGQWRRTSSKKWKKVAYGGNGQDGAALLAMLERNGVVVDDQARQCVAEMPTTPVRATVDLVRRTGWELGLTDPATFDEIEEYVKRFPNLGPCPAQAAVQLRVEWSDQALGDGVYVFRMKPATADGHPRVFYMSHERDGLHLTTRNMFCARTHMRNTWHPDATWVIAVRPPSA